MSEETIERPEAIISFWQEAGPQRWFVREVAFDETIRSRFLRTHEKAAAGASVDWAKEPQGTLALLLLLDQFPRNMFRGEARAFATDAQARAIANVAIARGDDLAVPPALRSFFYLPLMHSEDIRDQERCVVLCQAARNPDGLRYAVIHAEAIRRFGRFPHRNTALSRPTTAAEQAYLDADGFKG
ncbi:MAG: DUF924 domain-containing protein [Pseudorhodoplanes sp.]|nr:DUF924 domain-containing protein [Pseudorhodoplanes sp.]